MAPARALADVYVRHAMPVRSEGRPSEEWELGPEGRTTASELAGALEPGGPVAVVVASSEPKAAATAAPIAARFGAEVCLDDRLREVGRPWVGEDYRRVAHGYLRGDDPPGWEPQREVAARVEAALVDATSAAPEPGSIVVVVGHGLALAVHLASVLPVGFDGAGFWSRLTFPDAWSLDHDALCLRRALDRRVL